MDFFDVAQAAKLKSTEHAENEPGAPSFVLRIIGMILVSLKLRINNNMVLSLPHTTGLSHNNGGTVHINALLICTSPRVPGGGRRTPVP